MVKNCLRFVSLVVFFVPLLQGCATGRTIYYKAEEKIGREKRDILVSRVKSARDEQDAAKQQFKTTLQRFQEVTNFNGGELEAKYKKLNAEYVRCQTRAEAVSTRIRKVETVAGDMFKEWADENKQYTDQDKRRTSEKLLAETKAKYGQLIGLMKKSEEKMTPVLAKFNDNVLFLKHNLNASAISSLQGTAGQIETDVQALIKDMEVSIAEADAFMRQMK
jgi:hypothetical protein